MTATPILLMVQSLGHGGCERDAAKLAIGLDKTSFEPHIGILRPGGFRFSEVRDAKIPIAHFPVTSFMKPSIVAAAKALGNYVERHRIKLIQAFDVPTDIFGAIAARYYGVPSIITSQLSYRSLVTAKERLLLRITDRLSDKVVVNSDAVGRSLCREYGLRPEKVFLCYNGVNSADFYPGSPAKPDFLAGASTVVGSVCVMRPEKRIDWLIRSFAAANYVDAGSRLVLVGDGPQVPALKELAQSLGIAHLTYFVPGQSDVANWMRLIDIYVNASVSESFPNALLEAMACGCCPIGSRVGGIPELITHESTGLTFDSQSNVSLTEALKRVLSDREQRETFRKNASAAAHSNFSMAKTIARMQKLYLSLLHPKAPVSA